MKTRVTYLDHSGFAIERDEVILVFDYYRDPSESLTRILRNSPDKPVVFMVSHHHEDHFNPVIFNMAQNHKRVYVLSNDIKGNPLNDKLPIAWIEAGDTLTDLPGDMSVRAFGSTDAGVSYLVTFKNGEKCFHAGDFNYWHWQDESTVPEVKDAYNRFVKEMQHIMSAIDKIDIVFFPVDPRQGQDYAAGARLFMENIKVGHFFPMHFWKNADAARCFEDYGTDNTECHALTQPGESAEV